MKTRDLSVYDFNEEDELTETCHHWSKLSNPKFDDDDVAMTKYQFRQHASSGPITQMTEIHSSEKIRVVAIDDDDCGFINDISAGPHDSTDNAASRRSEVFGAISDKVVQQQCHMVEDSVKSKNSSLKMEIKISCPLGLPPGNGHTSSSVPESPCSDGSVDAGVSDGCDSIQANSPSSSGSEQEESYVPGDGQAQDQSISGSHMEEIINVYTDYIFYNDEYFPAGVILFSKTTVEIVNSISEEDAVVSRFKWNIDDIHSIESQWFSKASTAKVKVRVLPRDAVEEENVHGMTGIEAFEFSVHDPYWLEKQDCIMSLNVRYAALWSIRLNGEICEGGPLALEDEVSSLDSYIPIFQEPFEEVVYPKGEADAVSISKRDVDLLEPDIFLNDTIVDFYMMYLKSEITSSDRRRFHFFNSFFFRKLADPDKNSSGVFDGKEAFQRVRKWTRKVNIFDKDYIFIPVNYNLHWSLIVICHPGEVSTFKDENVDESVKIPCILHMDSIRGSHTGLKDLMQSYLLEEWKAKQKETSEDTVSKFLNLRFLSLELPQQENFSDCGLFLLHYAELFIAEAPENFSPFQINKFANFLKPDWFMPGEASLKRVRIQKLIYELLEGPCSESGSPCNYETESSVFLENKEIDNGRDIVSNSPGKSWNPLHSQTVQRMELGLMDMSLYGTPGCNDVSGLGVSEILQQSQHYNQEASFGQPGCPMTSIKEEVEPVDHLAYSSQTELQPIDGVGEACDIGYTPTEVNLGVVWNLGLSNQEDTEENLLPSSNCSDDGPEELISIECEHEVQGVISGQNESPVQPQDNVDTSTESYASASSDMMETPAEDSQELARIYGNNCLEDSIIICNQEETKGTSPQEEAKGTSPQEEFKGTSPQEEAKGTSPQEQAKGTSPQEEAEASYQDFEKFDDDGNAAAIDEAVVVEDSSTDTDEEQAAKRIRLTTSGDGERELITSLTKQVQV